MKNLIFVLLLAIIFQNNTQATNPDTLDYTVVANSGLSLRTAPYTDATRLDVIPYGTTIKTVGNWDEVFTEENIDTIDSRVGYWIETEHNGNKGFLFSGYLKTGPLYVPSTEINNDFRLTVPGERCQSINYDPALNWYGIYVDPATGKSSVKATNVLLEATTLSWEDEEMAYADYGDFLNVKAAEQDSFLMFFGTKEEIDVENIAFQKSYFDNPDMTHWDKQGKFIFPYERVEVAQDGLDQYYLTGYESFEKSEIESIYNQEEFIRKYDIFLTDNQGGTTMSNGDTVCLSEAIEANHLEHYQYATQLGPRLVWQGDINNDGFPDMIFYTPYMAECCGGSISYHLLVSEKVNEKWVFKKAAVDEIFSCYGC